MISKEKILETLRSKGINLDKIVIDPKVYDKAFEVAYKSIPIPWRWVVGRKRVGRMMSKLRDQIGQIKPQS